MALLNWKNVWRHIWKAATAGLTTDTRNSCHSVAKFVHLLHWHILPNARATYILYSVAVRTV